MIHDFLILAAIGFGAQIVDGALGMAFGVISTTSLLLYGLPPAMASATVHTAEVFTSGTSAISHIAHGNINWKLVGKLAAGGILGAILGALILVHGDLKWVRPFIFTYLTLLGVYILLQAYRLTPHRDTHGGHWAFPLGFVAGLLDTSGGGGWGPVATTTLVGSGHAPRCTIGSVNTAEFAITVAGATTFLLALGTQPWFYIVAFLSGGLLAAPLGARLTKYVEPHKLMWFVGWLVILSSLFQIVRYFKLV